MKSGNITTDMLSTHINRRHLVGSAAMAALATTALGAATSVSAQDSETPVRGGSITIAVVGPITSLDPFSSKLASGDAIAYQLIYNTLVQLSPTGEIIPELASEWTISEDGLTYTFTLQPGVTFHDGTPLDASAVVFNLDRYRAEGTTFPDRQ